MKIYYTAQSKIDPRLEQFIGTDVWVLMDVYGNGKDCHYVNILDYDGEQISYHVFNGDLFNKLILKERSAKYAAYILDRMLGVYHANYARSGWKVVEPLSILTTDEIESMCNEVLLT